MARLTPLLFVMCLLCTVWYTESHVRFVCPRPASARSDISFSNQSLGYCGSDMNAAFEKEHMEVYPGLFTLHFEESQLHRNSPFRVSLHDADSADYCLLLDHIPHNNGAILSHRCADKSNEYPLGQCKGSSYFITVRIPDMQCDRCYLRLSHILLDTEDGQDCDLGNGTCQGHVSCASIKIKPSSVGSSRNLSSCVKYEDNLAGNWPFRTQEYYQVEFAIGDDLVEPLLVLDPKYRSLHMDIPRHGFPTEIVEVGVSFNDSLLWNTTLASEQKLPDTVVAVWTGMGDDNIQHLRDGHLILAIRCEDEKSFIGNISVKEENYEPGVYVGAESADYTTDGWLADYRFRSIHAKDLTVVSPAGPCAPTPRYFIAFLHPRENSHFMHGILAASIVGDYADITVVVYDVKFNVTSITVHGSELLGAPDLSLPVSLLKNSILQVSLDVSQQTPYIDTVRFLKSVTVETSDPAVGLSGNFQEGIFTVLRDERGEVKGVGAFQFTEGQWLKYEILISGLESAVEQIELIGDGDVSHSLSHNAWGLSPQFCLIEGLVQDLDSKLLLRLWQGRLQLTAATNSSIMQGRVTVPGAVYCREAVKTACFAVDLTVGAGPEDRRSQKLPPSGRAVFLLDAARVLQYSIEVGQLHSHRELIEASVRDGDKLVFVLKLLPSQAAPATYTATGQLQGNADLARRLSSGGLRLEVFPESIRPQALLGYLPPVTNHLCLQPRTRIVGKHRGFWSVEAAPFQTIFAIIGDSLVFEYSGNVSLYSFTNEDDYLSCNFTSATHLGPESVNGSANMSANGSINGSTNGSTNGSAIWLVSTYVEVLDQAGSRYFASRDHCHADPPLRLMVVVVKSESPAVGDSSDRCGWLVLSGWRQRQLDEYRGPQPTGAAVAGLVLGVLTAFAFFLWDRRLRHKADTAVPGSRFQRF